MRGKLIILCIVGVVVLTGCLHSGGGGSGSGEPIENVPSQANFLMQIDGGILEDPTTEQLVDASIEMSMENSETYDGPESYEEWLNNLSSETEIDPTAFNKGIMFGEIPEDAMSMSVQPGQSQDQYFGFLFTADWNEDQFIDSLRENASVSTEEYSGTTVYVVEPETEEEAFESETQDTFYASVLPDGTFSLGTENAVKDSLDVANGDAEALSGGVREEFDRVRDGYISFAASIPDYDMGGQDSGGPGTGPGAGPGAGAGGFQSFSNVSVASGAYYVSGEDTIGMKMNMRADSSEDATNIKDGIDGMVSLASLSSEAFSSMVDPVEVSIEDTTVVVNYEVTVEEATQMMEDLQEYGQQQAGSGEFGSGTGGGDFGSGSGGSGFEDGGGGSFDEGDFEDGFDSNTSSSGFQESSP